jgi:hypothetical protein
MARWTHPSGKKRGSTTAWRRLRLIVLERDSWSCQVTDDYGRLCGRFADTCGHIGTTGLDLPELLQAQCRRHNYSDGGKRAHVANHDDQPPLWTPA